MRRWLVLPLAWLSISVGAAPEGSLYKMPGQWRDDSARDLALDQFRGRWVIATLAYAHCRGICTMTVENLKKVEAELGPTADKTEFVLFSIDPTPENPEDMRSFLTRKKAGGEHWHFLSGGSENTRKVAAALGMAFGPKSARGAHIMHTFKFALVSPDGVVLNTMDAMQVHDFSRKTLAAIAKAAPAP